VSKPIADRAVAAFAAVIKLRPKEVESTIAFEVVAV
jgi:hypothetical protein